MVRRPGHAGHAKGIAVSDIFAEVDEELRADRAQKLLKKYGGVLIGAAAVVVACVAGWQAWRAHETRETARVASIFLEATKSATAAPGLSPHQAALCGACPTRAVTDPGEPARAMDNEGADHPTIWLTSTLGTGRT